jgi:antitoxin component YwqK of YwqJK toxin-antitoxin module
MRGRAPRHLAGLILTVASVVVSPPTATAIPDQQIDASRLRMVGAVLLLDGTPFSGYAIEHEGSTLRRRTPLLDGREHGLAEAWYPNGVRRYARTYVNGLREGVHYGFWSDGGLQFAYRYENGLNEGEQVAYYRNGVRSESLHFHEGREEGSQRTWNGEGRLTSNYSIVNGRRYGLVGRMDCVSVRSE